ncbi:MAG TPA: hypothetical protein VGD37_09845 [Kofleriaceae bacterium]
MRAARAHRLAAAAIALAAIAVAWGFAVTVLRHTRPMGLPLDDSYIYLTYARQLGRGEPFTYVPGGGYSAGATSLLWPMLLAPLWTLGARGHALVWAVFVASAALYAATALGVYRVVGRIAGRLAGGLAAVIFFGVAAYAWSALSGMEVALTGALLVALVGQLGLGPVPGAGPPPGGLGACLAALTLSRPEAAVVAIAVIAVAAAGRLRRRELRAALGWLVPLAPMAAWLSANRLLAGHWLPNPALAKGHFDQPGFDATYWCEAVWTLSGQMLRGVFWDPASPLVWPRAFAVLWLVGAARVIAWARRERRWPAALVLLAAPAAVMFAVIASTGLWSFQNHRCIAPAFPLLAITAGCALGPIDGLGVARGRPALPRIHAAAAIALVAGFAITAVPRLVADARLYAQGATDTNTQVVAIGEYLHRKLPGARVLVHDAGAIAYYSDGRIDDLVGLVGGPAGVANHGPGARFEFLDSLLPEQRFSHFAVYPGWLGTTELYGDDLFHTPLWPRFEPRRLAGDADLQLIAARWDHTGTGDRPLSDHTGWAIVDRIDVADLASEAAHGWVGALGRRRFGDPTARWSVIGREVGPHGLVLDGGRTIRGGTERFTLAIDPARPVRLVLRTGGARSYPEHEVIEHAVALRILDGAGRELARATLPAPTAAGGFAEVAFALPAGSSPELRTEAPAPYRAFHWFALQPE